MLRFSTREAQNHLNNICHGYELKKNSINCDSFIFLNYFIWWNCFTTDRDKIETLPFNYFSQKSKLHGQINVNNIHYYTINRRNSKICILDLYYKEMLFKTSFIYKGNRKNKLCAGMKKNSNTLWSVNAKSCLCNSICLNCTKLKEISMHFPKTCIQQHMIWIAFRICLQDSANKIGHIKSKCLEVVEGIFYLIFYTCKKKNFKSSIWKNVMQYLSIYKQCIRLTQIS